VSGPAPPWPYYRYDVHGALRLRLLDWTVLLFLCRHAIGGLVLGIAGGQGGSLPAFSGLLEPWFLIADAPALLVFLAALNRVPNAGAALRVVWRFGRWLVIASAFLYAGIFLWLSGLDEIRLDALAGLSLALSAGVILYALVPAYVRDLYASFPEKPKASAG